MQSTKKVLSLLLAVLMLMSSMSVCFGTLAAGGATNDAPWQPLVDALNASTVLGTAVPSGPQNNYEVHDPDGSVIKIVEAYWDVVDHLANKELTDEASGYSEANRTYDQIHTTIMNTLPSKMDFSGDKKAFIEKLLCSMDPIGSTLSETQSESIKSSAAKPAKKTSNLPDAPDVTIKVILDSALTAYATVDDLPAEGISSDKTFKITHAKTYCNYSKVDDGEKCEGREYVSYSKHSWNFFYTVETMSESQGPKQDVSIFKTWNNTLKANAAVFGADTATLVAMGAQALADAKKAINDTYTAVVNAYGVGIYNHFFSAYNVAAATSDIDFALRVIDGNNIAALIKADINTDYTAMDVAAITSHYETTLKHMNDYKALAQDVRDYVKYDLTDAEKYLEDLNNEKEKRQIAALKAELDAAISEGTADHKAYEEYSLSDIESGALNGGDFTEAITYIDTMLAKLDTYKPENVTAVCGSGYAKGIKEGIRNDLVELAEIAGYNDQFVAAYNHYINEIVNAFNTNDMTALLNAVKSEDKWYSDLIALVDTMKDEIGGPVTNQLTKTGKKVIDEGMANAYARLDGHVTGQITSAYALYETVKAEYGTVTFVNIDNYRAIESAIGGIDSAMFDYLNSTEHHDLAPETVAKYDELKQVILALASFEATKGMEGYIQREIEYTDRPVYSTDLIKTEDYEVTEENILKVIDLLDGFLTGETFETLAGKSLDELLGGMVEDLIFSDSFINTIVYLLYDIVVGAFADVWVTLPAQVEDVPILGTLKITYLKDLYETLDSADFNAFPALLASQLPSKYSEAKAALSSVAYEEGKDFKSYWSDPRIYDGKALTLKWGVDEAEDKEDAFYEAFGAAMSGLNHLLFALLCDTSWTAPNIEGFAQVVGGLGKITLDLSATANAGYSNAIVPLLEALGADSSLVRTDNSMKSYANANNTENVGRAIFEPIMSIIDKVCAAPIETILDILPNLVYALESGMVIPILDMLKTSVNYKAVATAFGQTVYTLEDAAHISVGSIISGLKPSEDGGLDIGALLSDPSLEAILELLGLPLPPLDATAIAYAGTMSKNLDTKRLAYIYDTQYLASGKAYHIEADKADLLYYIVTYALNLVNDEAAFNGLLESLMVIKETVPVLDENGNPTYDEEGNPITEEVNVLDENGNTIPDTEAIAGITDIIDMLALDTPGDVIAAIVELLNMEKYGGLKDYTWYEGVLGGTVEGLDPALLVYLSANNDWNEDKAQYAAENLSDIIEAILVTAGVKDSNGNPIKIADEMAVKYAGAFTNATITSLAKTLGGLFAKDESAEGETAEEGLDVFALIKSIVGLDLASLAQYADIADDYDWGFTDGDVARFFAALRTVIAPFDLVVDFLFNNGELTLTLAEGKTVTLYGNDGYNTALIPLLEALGCELPENAPADTLAAVLDSVAALLEKVKVDPVDTILEVLPSVLYYLESNALSVGVFNLLQPIYAVLDVIRPIIDKDLIGLIEMIIEMTAEEPEEGTETPVEEEGFDVLEFITSLNLDDLGVNFVLDLLNDLLLGGADLTILRQVIADVCKVIGAEYDTVSTFVKDAKKGQYGTFSKADMVTVILSVIVDTFKVEGNAEKLNAAFGTDIITGLVKVFEGTPTKIDDIEWMYFFGEDYDFTDYDFSSGVSVAPTIESLEYPTDWTRGTAAYLDENLDEIIAAIITLINGEDAETDLGVLIGDLLVNEDGDHVIYNEANIEAIIKLLVGTGEEKEDGSIDNGLLGGIDARLLEAAGILLNADLDALKAYTVPEINNGADFAAALADVLGCIPGIVNWLLFGADYELLLSADNTAGIKIYGAEGYKYGLAPVLEALGVAIPASNDVEAILGATFERLDAILADPVNEALALLPNIIYFINADGLTACVNNLLSAVYALLETINTSFDANININELLGFNLQDLSARALFNLAQEKTGLDLSAAGLILYDLCVGTIKSYESVLGYTGFKMGYDDKMARYDMITILATVVLMVVDTEGNAEKLDEMLGTDGIVATIKTLITGVDVNYSNPNWGYAYSGDELIDYAITYPNDWTDDTAEYVYKNIDGIVAAILDMAGVTPNNLSDLLKGLVDGKIYTGANIQAIVDAITDLLGGIDETLITAAGKLLGADIEGLKAYQAPEDIDTAEEFSAELADVLNKYAGKLVDWLLFGKDYQFFLDETKVDTENYEFKDGDEIITISGGEGYAKGLALILEALGVAAPETDDVKAVLDATFARLEEILANPVEEIFNILPNVIYFINAGGIEAAIDNLTAGLISLIDVLEPLGVKLNLADLIKLPELLKLTEKDADKDWLISIDNLSIDAIVETVTALTSLDLSAAQRILKNFALGKVELYDSVSYFADASKMVYTDEFSMRDMLTVLITTVLLVLETEGNAEALDEMLGSDIGSSILAVMQSAPVIYASPNWEYCWNGGVTNGTVEVMEYAITYPNKWTEESAIYVTENLTELGDLVASLIDSNYSTLGDLIDDKLVIYSSENVQAIVDAIAGLLGEIDATLIAAAGKLLGADIAGLAAYKAPAGIDTAEEFAAELTNVLDKYAGNLIDWLLFGRNYEFFVDKTKVDGKVQEGEEIITINGAYGYAEGLALVLEALGCENLPNTYDNEMSRKDALNAILTSLFNRVDDILADPVDEVFNLLPNLLYFLNANGVAIAVDNLTAGLTALLDKLAAFGLDLSLNSLINIPELLGLEGEYQISIDNLTVEAIIELVEALTGLKLDKIDDVLSGFALGEIKEYTSVSTHGKTYKMYYNDKFAKYDMVTVIATLVLITVEDKANEAKLKEMLGADIYDVIMNIFNLGEVPVQEFNWQFTEDADTGKVFSAIETSELYKNHKYGPLYTEEMAHYIADNFGEFVDNIIYLLGIQINGKNINGLIDLLNGLVGGGLYNSNNAQAIADALAGVVDSLEGLGNGAGKHIIAVLKTSLGVDLMAYETMTFDSFENDRAAFEAAILKIAEPIYPLLKWLLANEDISFFVDAEKQNLITLNGAEGYAYGIIPLLEVLECENVMTKDAYNAAVKADDSVLITSILPVILDRLDVILADPANEILSMLPNLIYFINSNGVDTVVKNTLNAVYAVFNAIEPVAKIDIYELIGLDLSTLTFEKLFDMLLDMIADATGYRFESLDASAVAELTIGTLVSYESANGKKAYKMVYQSEDAPAEMVTVIMRLLITFIMHENNQEMLIGLLKDNLNMSADAEKYVRGVLDTVATLSTETYLGMDKALAMLYYLFYGLDIGAGELAGGLKDVNSKWQEALKELGKTENGEGDSLGNAIADFLDTYLDDVLTSEGLAPNGLIAFFQKIISWFKAIIDWFKNLFA